MAEAEHRLVTLMGNYDALRKERDDLRARLSAAEQALRELWRVTVENRVVSNELRAAVHAILRPRAALAEAGDAVTDSLRELAEKVRQGFIDPSEYPRHHAETSAALEEILRRLEIAEEEARAEYDARQDSHRRVEELKHALREIAERCESEDYSSEEEAEFAASRARAALATVGASGPTRGRQCLDDSDKGVGASSAHLAVATLLNGAIEDAMVLREEAAPHDGLAAGLVATLERVHAALRVGQ